eukprot:GFUD01019704.1.p1 GENE.GFUD01019704.1~~GFUD01019704.1.p1  ORF type:complete len:433 (-),score=68.04 GFUD01019704.1:76-1374(-)
MFSAFLLLLCLFNSGLGFFYNKPIRKALPLTHSNQSPTATPELIPSFSTAKIVPKKAEAISSLLQSIPKINTKAFFNKPIRKVVVPKSVHTARRKIDLGSLVQNVDSDNHLQKIAKSMKAAVVSKKEDGLQINAKSKKTVLAENNLLKIVEETYHPAVSEQSVDSGTADVQGFKVEGDTSNKIVFIDLEKLREAGINFDDFNDLSLGSSGGKTLEQIGDSQTSSSNFNSIIEETIRQQESSTYSSQPIIATQQVIAHDPASSQVSRDPDSVSSSSSQVPSKPSVSTATQQVVPVGVKVVDLSQVPVGASQVFPSSLVPAPAGANQVIGVSQVLGSSSVNTFSPSPIQAHVHSLEMKPSSIPIQVVGSSGVPTGANQIIASSPVFFNNQQHGGNYAIQKPKVFPAKVRGLNFIPAKASTLSFASFPSFPPIRK